MLRIQLQGSFALIGKVADETSVEEWKTQASVSLNPAGFTLWHCVRSIDWAVNCAILGIPEVANQPRWQGMLASSAWYGYDVSLETACEVAAAVSRAELIEYADEVQSSVMTWFDSKSESDLDTVPDLRRNFSSNGMYLTSPRLEAWIEEDIRTPTWRHLAGACVGHIRVHMGEVQALLQVLRSQATAVGPSA